MMDFLKIERFYSNECCVCKSTTKIKRCARCYMVSYCGVDHQKQHWKHHKDICKVIFTIMKEKKVSHLLEKLRGSDSSTWIREKEKIAQQVQTKLGRSFRPEEHGMFKFPRACFVCYDTRPEKLKKCPGCSSANFCCEHPSSPIHDRICSIMKNHFIDFFAQKAPVDSKILKSAIKAMGSGITFPKSGDFPTSMREFIDLYTKPEIPISEDLKIINSQFFTISLTLFSALRTLDVRSPEIILHVDAGCLDPALLIGNYWEVLLHFIPSTKILKIVHIEWTSTHKAEVHLCKKCRSSKRRLFVEAHPTPYERYLQQTDYQTPNVIAYLNVNPPEKYDFNRQIWERRAVRWSKVTCPMLLTTLTERGAFLAREIITTSTTNFRIIYDGCNNYPPLIHTGELEDGTLRLCSQFMILFKQQEAYSESNDPSKIKVNRPRSFFYATVCQVCRSANPKVTCNRCRMIFYCGNKHRDEHQIHHQDICRVILSMLSEMEAPNIFDKFKTADPDLWLRAKINLMKTAKSKIGRKLQEYEEQMFLFPKTCIVCHDSDLSVLKNCECGVNLCKIHKEHSKHTELCSDLTKAFRINTSTQPVILKSTYEIPVDNEGANLPFSMLDFLNSHVLNIKLKDEITKEDVNFQGMIISNFYTGPLTLLWAMKRLGYKIHSSMVIHIIGASSQDIVSEGCWKIFLYWLTRLASLKIVFIGPDISNCLETEVDTSDFPSNAFPIVRKSLKAQYVGLRYDEYFNSESFIKPDIILGCNLDIHESELGISDCTWKDSILTLKKVGVPFILTAGTEERAEKDHNTLCKLLGMPVDYKVFELNPHAALAPERDFETEGVRYSNKYIIIYDGKYRESVGLKKGEEEKLEGKSSNY